METRVVAIARRLKPGRLPSLANALLAGGIHALELTLDSDDALASISALADQFGPELAIGAGTVISGEDAIAALSAQASFLIAPCVAADVISTVAEAGVPIIPGAMTPTEILSAWDAGASAVKIFPAATLGPGFVRAVRQPLASIPLMPTGGIDATNTAAFLDAGACAVAVGGWLFDDLDPSAVRTRAAQLIRSAAWERPA